MSDDGCVIRLRGLPWSATQGEVVDFLKDVKVKDDKNGIHFTLTMDGRPSGDAFVELQTPADVELATKLHKEKMGHRYVEVFPSNHSEMNFVVRRGGLALPITTDGGGNEHYVKLRGLPYECTKKDIINFFDDANMEVAANCITLPMDSQGRPTGEAFVQFASDELSSKAIDKKNRDRIAHRYVEMFKSSSFEARQAEMAGTAVMNMQQRAMMGGGRPTPYDRGSGGSRYGGMGPPGNRMGGVGRLRGSGDQDAYVMDSGGRFRYMPGRSTSSGFKSQTGHVVHMRGVPFKCTDRDIISFFAPLQVMNVHVELDYMGRPSGEADVDFLSHEEAVKAMSRDRQNMGHRYIELFLVSKGR